MENTTQVWRREERGMLLSRKGGNWRGLWGFSLAAVIGWLFIGSECWEPAYCILSAYFILSAALSTASSFRIWNSSTGILSLPGASVRNSAHDKGHEEVGSAYAKAGLSLRSPPGNSWASTPQTWVCLLSALCFHPHLWLYGGCPPLPLSEKRVSLQLQLTIPGCDSVSTYKLLWKSSSLPE